MHAFDVTFELRIGFRVGAPYAVALTALAAGRLFWLLH
ncbi:putative membrane protein [Brucella pseudogrignonensis]|uniref:Putative membrane protein n=1 Tax=Brucella pseudogrignonensis TaxID=419475 RepID=A0A256G3N3_9HYPH|nr:putative membrane protein [Brucella pseudogrignonensis]